MNNYTIVYTPKGEHAVSRKTRIKADDYSWSVATGYIHFTRSGETVLAVNGRKVLYIAKEPDNADR